MNEVIEFLNECGTFFVSTVDGDQPKVRPFGFVMEHDGKLCICTNNQKPVFAQLKANSAIEICGCKGPDWVRLYGKAIPVTSEASQQKALEIMPMLSNMYSVGDGVFEILAIENATADFCSMTGESHQVTL
ncbi:pyridoxamine 5'-phosphate oxidase family protein [Eubacteriaceae bacterium ES2]|nr:pyridoxamine 5'-phosphate oxidase family protein [Eubacteriaceae bacterium ES2]